MGIRGSYLGACICIITGAALLAACPRDATQTHFCTTHLKVRLPSDDNPLLAPDLVYVHITADEQTVFGGDVDLFSRDQPGGVVEIIEQATSAQPEIFASDGFRVSLSGYRSQDASKTITAVGRTPSFACGEEDTQDVPLYIGTANGFDKVAGQHARQGATASSLGDGRVLIIGGEDANGAPVIPEAVLYDHRTGAFCTSGAGGCLGGDIPTPRTGHSATTLEDGRVLIFGGQTPDSLVTADIQQPLDDAYLFEPSSNTFQKLNFALPARTRHSAVLLEPGIVRASAGLVLVLGGSSGNGDAGAIAAVVVLDPIAVTTLVKQDLTTARFSAAAALLPSGEVLITGGRGPTGILDSVERYDFNSTVTLHSDGVRMPCANPGSSPSAHMCSRRSGHTITVVGSNAVLWGGIIVQTTDGLDPPPYAEAWLLESERMIPVNSTTPIPEARVGHTVTPFACRQSPCPLLILGGDNPTAPGTGTTPLLFTPAWPPPAYDAASFDGSIRDLGSLRYSQRSSHAVAVLSDGAVLVTGGVNPFVAIMPLVLDAAVFSFCQVEPGSDLSCP